MFEEFKDSILHRGSPKSHMYDNPRNTAQRFLAGIR
jgi:hypothetical protein